MTLGTLALHVASIPGAIANLLSELERQVPNFTPPEATSVPEILSALDRSVAAAAQQLSTWSDHDFNAEWKMKRGDQTLLAMPRIQMVRGVMLNHWYHHRGQLTVYLRLLDVPVPVVYGQSADERPLA
jgi:uncharacterized damage-inducible protein DinB